jgi:hypothetical protein
MGATCREWEGQYGTTSILAKLTQQYGARSRQAILNRIETDLRANIANNRFFEILKKIDFSRFAKDVSKKLLEKNNNFLYKYVDETMFIPGDNIAAVEIIGYESFHAIRIVLGNAGLLSRIIPKSYEQKEFVYSDKVRY